jgi:hypothetical protein
MVTTELLPSSTFTCISSIKGVSSIPKLNVSMSGAREGLAVGEGVRTGEDVGIGGGVGEGPGPGPGPELLPESTVGTKVGEEVGACVVGGVGGRSSGSPMSISGGGGGVSGGIVAPLFGRNVTVKGSVADVARSPSSSTATVVRLKERKPS